MPENTSGVEGRERSRVSEEVADRFRSSTDESGYSEEGYEPGIRSAEDECAITTCLALVEGLAGDVRGDFEDPLTQVSGEHSLALTPTDISHVHVG